ncbi:hypothetical protein AP222_05560, partial [Escherichia coli]
ALLRYPYFESFIFFTPASNSFSIFFFFFFQLSGNHQKLHYSFRREGQMVKRNRIIVLIMMKI